MASKPRKLLTIEELSDWFTEEIQRTAGFAGTTISVQYPLAEPDDDGCNWSTDLIINFGDDANPDDVRRALEAALMPFARRTFNLTDD